MENRKKERVRRKEGKERVRGKKMGQSEGRRGEGGVRKEDRRMKEKREEKGGTRERRRVIFCLIIAKSSRKYKDNSHNVG